MNKNFQKFKMRTAKIEIDVQISVCEQAHKQYERFVPILKFLVKSCLHDLKNSVFGVYYFRFM